MSGGFIEYANAPEKLRVEVNDGYLKIFQEVLQFNRDAGLDASLVDEVQQQWDDYYANGNTKLFSSPEFLALQLCMLEGNTYDFQHTYATDVEGGTAWLDTMQFPWMPLVAIPGYSWAHFSGSSEDVNGEGYFNVFEREMEGLDLRILFATPATELITESGRVTGVIGSSANGSTYTVRAKDGVVIASGGYADNQDMLKEHDKMWNWKDLDTFHCDNNYGHTGDGIRMATEAGAAFAELPFNQMVFPFVDTVLYATETTVGTTNESIYVNKAGKRFCDEGGSRTDMTIALMEQDGGVGFQVVDHDSSMITDGKTHTGMDVEYAIERGILYRADTLEELAGLMGVDEATFLKTVDDYNEMARTINDPEFGRSSFGPMPPWIILHSMHHPAPGRCISRWTASRPTHLTARSMRPEMLYRDSTLWAKQLAAAAVSDRSAQAMRWRNQSTTSKNTRYDRSSPPLPGRAGKTARPFFKQQQAQCGLELQRLLPRNPTLSWRKGRN